jgi:hypothetical protein
MRQWTVVATFGGGLNYRVNPAAIEDSQWGRALNFVPDEESAATAPTYDLLLPSSYTFSPPQTIFGILNQPYDEEMPLLFLTYEFGVGGANLPVHLYKCQGTPSFVTPTEIPWDGVGTRVTYAGGYVAVQSAFLNGWFVFTVGAGGPPGSSTGFSMGQWNGGATWATLTGQKATFRCAHLASFAGHLIAACVGDSQGDVRTVRISAADSTTVWTPDISNDADFGALDDALSGINALALLQANALGVFTRAGTYALSPTGQIPPFTRNYIGAHGCIDTGNVVNLATSPWADETPLGACYASFDNIYLGPGQPIGSAIHKAWREDVPDDSWRSLVARTLWHPRWNSIFIPQIVYRSTGSADPRKQQFFVYNADHQAWGTVQVPGPDSPGAEGEARDHAMIMLGTTAHTDIATLNFKHMVLHADNSIWVERENTPLTDTRFNYVESKDFALPEGRYVVAVKVDWEAVTLGTQLTVQCAARDQLDWQAQYPALGPATAASPGWYVDLSPVFDALGPDQQCTLAQGESEGPLNVRGKWVRFRFSHTGGAVRIRGFAFAAVSAGDRTTSPNPSTAAPAAQDRRRSEWDRDDLDIGEWN